MIELLGVIVIMSIFFIFYLCGDYIFLDGDNNVATFDYYATKKEEFVYTIDNTIIANILPLLDEEIKSYATLVLDRSGR